MKNADSDDDAATRGSDELRALWSALPAPHAGADEDGLPSADLADSDSATRAAVERLQMAWAAHSVAVPDLPFALRRVAAARATRSVPRWRRAATKPAARLFALAGAAAAAAALIVGALRTEREAGTAERSSDGAVATGTRLDTDAHAPRDVQHSSVPEVSVATLVEIPREDFKLRADGFEFESRGVRFVLIENTGGAPSSASGKKE